MPATRFKIPDIPDVLFEIQENENEEKGSKEKNTESLKLIPVDNISITGIALKLKSSKSLSEVGQIIKGKLIKGERSVQTQIKVVHKTGHIVGCQFMDSLPKIERFVSDEVLKDLFPSLKSLNLQSKI